ncbi:MAG: nitroreductase family protein [Anaerovoracaceae bacterium]|nr:nitroreductase family protein [Bacillota bacterium]MDY2669992.1 nitroreductase family protein [Anaerovoracaceae bacterium]
MDFLELAGSRYSCRRYSDKPVEREKSDKILAAAGIAPTAHNYQPFRLYVLRSPEALAKIRGITKMTFDAPLVFIVCTVAEEGWVNEFTPDFNAAELDSGIVISHMMLEAKNEGVESICACWFDNAKVKEAFSIPDGQFPVALVSFGYPTEETRPAKLHTIRRDMGEVVKEL